MVREVLVTLRHHCRRLFLTRRRLEENRERENLRGDKSSPKRFRQVNSPTVRRRGFATLLIKVLETGKME